MLPNFEKYPFCPVSPGNHSHVQNPSFDILKKKMPSGEDARWSIQMSQIQNCQVMQRKAEPCIRWRSSASEMLALLQVDSDG